MTFGTLVARGLRFHWRSHLGLFLGATLATAILVGALAVGDSVRASLVEMALARLGDVRLALNGQGRFFRAALATELGGELGAPVAPVILLRGTAVMQDPERHAFRVQVVGADSRFWEQFDAAGAGTRPSSGDDSETVTLNTRLARQLRAGPGDEVLLRVEKPALLSRDAPLSTVADANTTLRVTVAGVMPDRQGGRFSLEANQVPPLTAVVPLATLGRAVGMDGRANALLVGGPRPGSGRQEPTAAQADAALWKHWQLEDAGLELRRLAASGELELRTDRVFLNPSAGQAAMTALPGAQGILTYFVNELRVGSRSAPYSTVTAIPPDARAPFLPPGMQDDEIVVNRWLADDLAARPGDRLRLTYFVVGPRRQLEERSESFRIRAVVPLGGPAADRELMPAFPGVADRMNCRDWEPGIPVNLDRIRDRDERYWDLYRGTPKAFVTLRAGQRMWNNRFGDLTAVRYPSGGPAAPAAGKPGASPSSTIDTASACIRQALNPATIGLYFLPARQQAAAAATRAMDFGQLFLGFSGFLIAAALLLAALLFALSVEQRSQEAGTLLAFGFSAARVRRLFLIEGAAVALAAAAAGTAAGALYTRAALHGLSSVWSGAAQGSELRFHVEPGTLFSGAAAAFAVALFSIWLVARRQAAAPVRQLLAGAGSEGGRPAPGSPFRPRRRPAARWCALLASLAALACVAAGAAGGRQAAEAFFAAGALLLIAGIAASRLLLDRLDGAPAGGCSLAALGARNVARRSGRSLAAAALLASGTFMVVAVGASRRDPGQDAGRRDSGTGGFSLYAETTLPVYHDLNAPGGRDELGLDAGALAGVQAVPLRRREGDDASCVNLNRVQTPGLLGVDPERLARRGAFRFAGVLGGDPRRPWLLLNRREPGGAVAAVGDVNTVEWSLGKSLGDIVSMTDDRGRPLELRIVGILSSSVLQGGLLISEDNFTRLFPDRGGDRVFLIDTPANSAPAREELDRALADYGIDIIPTVSRLAYFSVVENTYLSIFAALGGLGILLGSLGLGVVVLRNAAERRGELALLRAVGFSAAALKRLVASEYLLVLALGIGVGLLSALVAVLPSLLAPGAGVPVGGLAVLVAVLGGSGFLWVWGAATLVLRGPLLPALRSE